MRKSRLIYILIIAAFAVGIIFAVYHFTTTQSVQKSTIDALTSENADLQNRLYTLGVSSQKDDPETSQSPESSEPSAEDSMQQAIHAVNGYMQTLNQVSNTTTRQQQIDAIKNYATANAQKALWGDNPIQSDTGGDGSGSTFSQTCTQAAAYTSIVNTNTIDVFGVFMTQLTGGDAQTSGTILVTARCINQNGKWLVDSAKQSVPNNMGVDNFVIR